jgi:hypothetical protein
MRKFSRPDLVLTAARSTGYLLADPVAQTPHAALEGSQQGANEVVGPLGPDLDVVFTFYAEAARVRTVPADADGKPCRASIRMSACPLLSRGWINGPIFFASWRQGCEFGDQYAADNVRRPVNTRESFDQVTFR